MDIGPVDAGPFVAEYDTPTRSPSPGDTTSQTRFDEPRGRTKHSNGVHHAAAVSDASNASGLSSRKQSDDSLRDLRTSRQLEEKPAASVTSNGVETPKKTELRAAAAAAAAATADRGRVYKFTLYETTTRYWITGADLSEKVYRLLRVDCTSPPGEVGLLEDKTTYSLRQMNQILTAIDDGNKATGGLRKKCQFWGVLGFIRFTEAYYMLIVTKRQQVAMIGGHYVYRIERTELVPLTTGSSTRFARDRNPEEARLLGIFNSLDLSMAFYFSYAYDITNTLQHNIIRQREAIISGESPARDHFNSMFVWNSYLLQPALAALENPYMWCLPIIHGFIDQAVLDIFGRAVYITIIGRRSRFFAGARFLKRGVNDSGYVANDVETEQIVSEKLTTSFHAPGPRPYCNPTYTSFVQHRGSIPLNWTQDNSGVSPKPDINLNLPDPFYQRTALHFDNLFERYGCPIHVLNLIKSRERTPRESKLLVEFQRAIEYLNQSLPDDKKILYQAFDMSRAAKIEGGDVIGSLEVIAKKIVASTGFFRNGDELLNESQVQNGVARTNCVDCLDRTNAAQFVLGKRAFALQLKALGVIDRDEVDYDTDAVNIFTHMFHDHGDTIAVQYGGSHLVNTMATYRKLNYWQSSSRDMVESFKRYYHNSFLDNQRQEAYNLFLGNYVWSQGQPMLWDLQNDYYLHHRDPRAWSGRQRRNYICWYTPAFLKPRVLPPYPRDDRQETRQAVVAAYDDYWRETYRPGTLTTLGKVYSFRINAAANRFLPERPRRDSKYDFSPFKIRVDPHRPAAAAAESQAKQAAQRKGVKIQDPHETASNASSRPSSARLQPQRASSPGRFTDLSMSEPTLSRTWTTPPRFPTTSATPSLLSSTLATPTSTTPGPPPLSSLSSAAAAANDKNLEHIQSLAQIHAASLRPKVSIEEAREYERYIKHPLHLPLVVSDEQPSDANLDFVEYIHRAERTKLTDQFMPRDDLHQFWQFLRQRPDPLTVTEEDLVRKRYKPYRQWLRGKSLFKQSKIDLETKGESVVL